jgi:hypothetical protein
MHVDSYSGDVLSLCLSYQVPLMDKRARAIRRQHSASKCPRPVCLSRSTLIPGCSFHWAAQRTLSFARDTRIPQFLWITSADSPVSIFKNQPKGYTHWLQTNCSKSILPLLESRSNSSMPTTKYLQRSSSSIIMNK